MVWRMIGGLGIAIGMVVGWKASQAGETAMAAPTHLTLTREIVLPTSAERLRNAGKEALTTNLKSRAAAPRQGVEGAPDAWIEVYPRFAEAIRGLAAGDEVLVVTWLHRARRDVLRVHPRSDRSEPLEGVFATRSPDRPNPLGLHRATVRSVDGSRVRVGPIEAIDGTPVVDIKPVIHRSER